MQEEPTPALALASLLQEIAERQDSIEQRLLAIELLQRDALQKDEASDAAYRAELSRYRESDAAYRVELTKYQLEHTGLVLGRTLGAVMRSFILLLLIYVAYRLS